MTTLKTILTYFFVVFFVFSLSAQHKALFKIDKKDLKRHLTFLASDDLKGRKLGTEVDGLGIAADYLAKNAKAIGLKPGAENYFQKVELVSSKPDETNFISVLNEEDELLIRTNNVVAFSAGLESKIIESDKIVFLGFGDSDTTDIKGKIVIVAQGNTESFMESKSFRWNSRLERGKIRTLSEKEPKAIVFITNPNDKENKTFKQISAWFNREGYSLKGAGNDDETTVLATVPDFADKLIGGKGKYLEYLNNVAAGNKNEVLTIKQKSIKLKTGSITHAVDAKNVIGIVEGSDPKLKDEFVVFMAHYDHLGVGKDGDVYNGADDNGSGTVAILEVAEAFASLEVKPKRSIVFLWVTCEEMGHLGSTWYCDNPIYPLEKTVVSINLDMVGRVYESPRDDVYKDSPKKVKDFDGLYTLSNDVWPELADINAEKCKELGLIPDTSLPKERFLRASDHYHFHKKGVPILNYATGYHADYHKVGDEVEKINFDKIKRVADLCFLIGYDIANLEQINF